MASAAVASINSGAGLTNGPTAFTWKRKVQAVTLATLTKDGQKALNIAPIGKSLPVDTPEPVVMADTFLFNNPDYYALQRYVVTGIRLPNSNAMFQSTYDKALFDKFMKNIDSQLYDATQGLFVAVQNHTANFNVTTLSRIHKFATNVKLFSASAAALYKTLAKLITEIREESAKDDPDEAKIEKSKAGLKLFLDFLSKEIVKIDTLNNTIYNELIQFETVTINDVRQTQLIDDRFTASAGPIQQLVTKMDAEIVEIQGRITAAQKDWDRAQYELDVGPAYAWVGLIGLITYFSLRPGFWTALDAAAARKKKAQEDLASTQTEKAEVAKVVSAFNSFKRDTSDIKKFITGALENITTAKNCFGDMKATVESVQAALGAGSSIIDLYWMEEMFVEQMTSASDRWKEVETMAMAFNGRNKIEIVPVEEAEAFFESMIMSQTLRQSN